MENNTFSQEKLFLVFSTQKRQNTFFIRFIRRKALIFLFGKITQYKHLRYVRCIPLDLCKFLRGGAAANSPKRIDSFNVSNFQAWKDRRL